MPREPVNSPTVGLEHKPRSDPQQYSPPAQQVVTQGASDKQVSSLECFPLQAVHLDVASDCKIPGDSTGREKVGLLSPGECQCRLWVTVSWCAQEGCTRACGGCQQCPQVQTVSCLVAIC